MKRRNLVAIALAAAIGALSPAPPTAAAETAQWKMHIVWVPSRPEAVSMKEWAAKAEELSDGTLKIVVHDSGSLGIKDPDMLRVLPPGGTIQAAGLAAGYLARDVPELAYVLPIGVVEKPDDILKIHPQLEKIYNDIYDRYKIRLVGFVTSPIRTLHVWCKEPYSTLKQLKGKKVRVWSKFQVDTFAKLGVQAQIVPQNDLYLAMKTGVVDCAMYPISIAKTISLQEVAKHVSYLHPYADQPLAVIVSERAYQALPEQAKKAVTEAGRWITERTAHQYRAAGGMDDRGAAEVKAEGVTVHPDFPKADQAAYLKAARETWEVLAKETGKGAIKNYEIILGALEK